MAPRTGGLKSVLIGTGNPKTACSAVGVSNGTESRAGGLERGVEVAGTTVPLAGGGGAPGSDAGTSCHGIDSPTLLVLVDMHRYLIAVADRSAGDLVVEVRLVRARRI